jgi:hypothetical protein
MGDCSTSAICPKDSSGTTVQDLDCTNLEGGDVDAIVDGVASETMDYAYDYLGRLTEMKRSCDSADRLLPVTHPGGEIGGVPQFPTFPAGLSWAAPVEIGPISFPAPML